MTFCKRLRKLMLHRGITQAELARRMGVGRSCVCHWYWGVTEPKSIEMLRRLKRVLGCSWSELLGGE